jgi:hypothetical protein
MTDYGNVRSAATALVERFTDLEVDHQANRAFSTYAEQNPDAHDWTHEEKLEKLQIWSDQWRGEIRSWFADIEDLFDDLADFPEPGPPALQGQPVHGRTQPDGRPQRSHGHQRESRVLTLGGV